MNPSDLSIIRANHFQEELNSTDPQNSKILSKEARIQFLTECLSLPSSKEAKQKLQAQLAKETQKLSYLIDQQSFSSEELDSAKDCLFFAEKFLEPSAKTHSTHEMPTLPAWLKNDGKPVSTKEELTLFIGDPYAKTADMEGGQADQILTIILDYLENCPDFISKDEWLSLKNLLDQARTFGRIIVKEKFPDNVKTLKTSLEEALSNEKEILLPGGWTSNPHGHALYYKIIPQENGKYTFQIYNRGGGLEYAPSFPQEFKNLYPPFIEIIDIKKENLTDEFFLKVLIEQNQFPNNTYSSSESTNYNGRDIFERLLPLLEGKENERNFELEDLMSPQRHGTCQWKSLTAVIRHSLGYLPSKQLKMQFEMQLLWYHFRANENAFSKDLVECNALSWAVQTVTKTVQAMQGLISAEEYTQLIGLLAYMENSIDKARSQHIQAESAPHIPLTSDELNLPRHKIEELLSTLSAYSVSDEIKGCSQKLPSSDLLLNLNQWEPNAATLQKDLNHFCSLCGTAIQNEHYSDVNTFFLQLMRSLPVPTSDLSNIGGKFWQEAIQKHKESITELMQMIAQLHDHYYISSFYIEGSIACPPARTHAIVKSLHIQNILKLHSPLAQLGLTMPSDFTFLEQIFSEGKFRELNFCPTDPLIMQELSCIYQDLKQMAKPFLSHWIKDKEENSYQIRGLAFEWKNDLTVGLDNTGTPYSTAINDAAAYYLNPEFTFIQKQLKTDPEYFKKAAEWHEKNRKIEKPLDVSDIAKAMFGVSSNEKLPFHALNIYEQIALIYCEGPEELLPNPFIQWRNQVLQTHLMLYGYFFPMDNGRTISSQKEIHIQPKYEQTFRSMKDKDFFEFVITNKCPIFSNIHSVSYDESDEEEDIKKPIPFVNRVIPNRYLPNIRPFGTKAINQIHSVWKTHPHLTQNEIYSQTYPEIELPLQQKRELLTLGTHHDLQVEEAVAYFSKNIHLLKERDYQTLFHILLFEKDFLVKEINYNPNMVTHFENLVQHGYQLAYDSADIETCVYFINLSRHLKNTVAFIHPKKTTQFVPVHQSLCKLLSITGITGHDKSLLYQELIASFAAQKTICEEEIIIFIRALVCMSMAPIAIEVLRPDTVQEQRNAFAKFRQIIQASLEKDPNWILNEALAPIIENYCPDNWKETALDQFESVQGYILNPFNGDFFQKNQPAASLPQKILSNKTYKQLFNKSYPANRIDFRTYEFQDSAGDLYHIIFLNSKESIFQRLINGKWHQLRTHDLFNKSISLQHHIWVSCDLDRIELYDLSGTHKASANVKLGHKQKMTDKTLNYYQNCWIDSLKRRPDHLVNKELILLYSTRYTTPISDSSLNFLTNFEDQSFINAWLDDTETARLIELPRFDLTLVLDTKNSKQPRWICPQIPGYHLATNQISPSMGMLKGYFVFENKKEEQLIVHPLHPIDSKASDNHPVFSEQIAYARSSENTQRYVTYRLNKGKNGELVLDPTTSEACLYLAYLKLATGRYEEARYLLSLHRLPLRGNCDREFELLRQIIKLQEINNDDTGPGTALRLHAFYLYLELQERVGHDKQLSPELWKTIYETCQTYINQMFNTGTLQLPINEERVILHAIIKKYQDKEISPFLINYLKKIDPEFHYDQMASEGSISLNNAAQKTLYTTVKNICQSPYSDDEVESFALNYFEINPSRSLKENISNGIDDLRGKSAKQKSYLTTRPGKEGIQALLARWIGARNKEEILKEIRICLKSSTFDESSSQSLFRAVLEMISRHPKKYKIQEPSEETKRYKDKGSKPREEWFTQNILPILKDYLSKTPEPGPFSIPQKTGRLKPSSNSISMRKKELPTLEFGYINSRPESLTQPAKIQPTHKTPNFKPADYLVALSNDEIEKVKTERKEVIAQAHFKAAKIFSSEKSVNRCIANEYLRLREDCKTYAENASKENENSIPKIVPQNKLHELQDNLNWNIQNLQLSLHEREKILKGLVNPSKVDSHANAKIAVSFLSGKREKIGIEKLILLYARDQIDELAKQPSMLSQEDIALVKKLTFEYLVEATYMQQLQRILEKAQCCIKQWNKTSAIDPKKMQKLVNELSATRDEKEKYPACLVIEYWDNILMRPDQMEKMKLFYETGDIQPIVQMIMGAGKTSTLMPLLALFLANGINLSILLLPEEQLQSVFDELKMKLGEGFMQQLLPLVYGRNSDYSQSGLRKLKNKLRNIIIDKNCLISTPKSFHCIYLKAIETWSAIRHSHGEKRIELKQQYKLLREILNIFRKKGVVLMDEIHLIQYCRDEVNFPTGKIASINNRDMDLICEIYEGLLESEAIKPYLKAEFDPNKKKSNAPPYNDQMYHEKIKPVLAKEILSKLKDPNKIFGTKEITSRIHEFFNEADEVSIYQFLCRDKEGYEMAYDYVNDIRESDVKNLLFLAQKSLNDLLPCTLQQDCDDDYGVRTKRFATPLEKGKPILTFEKGNLVEGTRYEDPFESSQYTYQAYCKNGIPVQIVKEQIETLQKQAIDELKSGKNSSNSIAFQEFRDLSGSDRMHLLKLAPNDYEKITENIKDRKDLFRIFIKRYIFSTIRFYTRKYNSNAQTLNFLFSRVLGFSGTTSSDTTFPDSQTSFPSKGTDARTIFALLGHAGKPIPIDIVDFDHPQNFIPQLPFEANELVLIDSGAYLKGDAIANEAKTILKLARNKNPSIEGVAYFDDQGKKVILEHGKEQPVQLKDSKIKMEKRFTIYPKPFTTGANILQADHAIAYFTVGRNLTLQDFLQAVYRMRDIEGTHAIRLCISGEVKQAINAVLGRPPLTPITIDDVLEFAAANQANQVGDDTYLSLKQKMLAAIIKSICQVIFDEDLDPEDAAELFNEAVEEVFAPLIGEDAAQLYSGKEIAEDAEIVLDKYIEDFKALLEKVLVSSQLFKEKINKAEVEKNIEAQKKVDIVPEKLNYPQSNSNKLMQAQEQSETQTQTQTHTMQHAHNHAFDDKLKQWRYYEWPSGNIYDSQYYQPGNLLNLKERSWYLNQIGHYLPSPMKTVWGYSANISKKAWRCLPEYFRDKAALAGDYVLTGINLLAFGDSWMYPLKEFLAKDQDLLPFLSLFDDSLKVSHNFAPKIFIKPTDHIAQPFDENQKQIRHLLVSRNTENDNWEIMLLDKMEAESFRNKMVSHDRRYFDAINDDLKVCLQDLYLGSFQKGLFSPSADELQSEDYLKLLVQIKFLNGETLYNKTETELMKKWISSDKWAEIKNVYRNRVLAYHPDPNHVIKTLDTLFE